MSFAALSTIIAVFENLISWSMDKWGWSRRTAVARTAVIVLSLIHIFVATTIAAAAGGVKQPLSSVLNDPAVGLIRS